MASSRTYKTLFKLVLIAAILAYTSYYANILFDSPAFFAGSSKKAGATSYQSSQTSAPPMLAERLNAIDAAKKDNEIAPLGKLRIITQPNWHISGRLSEQMSVLQSQFEAGDLTAGYILAMNLRYCWNSPFNQHEFDTRKQTQQETHASDAMLQHLEDKYEKCQGIELKQQKQFYHYMRLAAEQGFIPAKESFAQLYAEFYMTSQGHVSLPRAEYIAMREQFINTKINFLTQAAEHGSIKAMTTLAKLYYSQNYGPHGWVKAFAYNQAILAFTEDNALYQRNQWYTEKLIKSLSAQELADAQAISENIIQAIKQNGTLYLVN